MKSATFHNSTHAQIELNQTHLPSEPISEAHIPVLTEQTDNSVANSPLDSADIHETDDPINWFLKCMGRHYFKFSGRATRSELWSFIFIGILVSFFTVATDDIFGIGTASYIVNGLLIIPLLAVGARRLHDIGLSGWWQLLYLTGIGVGLLLVMWLLSSKTDNNPYIACSTSPKQTHAYL